MTDTISILHLASEMTWRGGENQLRLLVEGLSTRGVSGHVAVQPESALQQRLTGLVPMLVVRMRNDLDFVAAWRIAAYVRQHRVDLIDAHTAKAHGIALLVRFLCPGVRLVVHRRVEAAFGRFYVDRLKYLSPKVDVFVAISRLIGRDLVSSGVPETRVRVVPSAVDAGRFRDFDRSVVRTEIDREFEVPRGTPLLCYASHLSARKGHRTLFAALEALVEKGHDFRCLIAGDGELRAAFEREVTRAGLDGRVRFLGFRDDVPRLLTASDIFVMPSEWEGLGTIILEAFHAGCCVVASDAGGIPELVREGETGLVFPTGDAPRLAERLLEIMNDPERRRVLNAAGRELARREFSLQAMVEGNLGVYREVLARSAS